MDQPALTSQSHRPSFRKVALYVFWITVAVFALYAAYVLFVFFTKPVPTLPPEDGGENPVRADDINSLEDLERLAGNQPIPFPTLDREIEPINPARDHIRGNLDAEISIVEFASPTSKFVAMLQPPLRELVERRIDVNLVYRHYPSTLNAEDYPVAQMSECVAREGGEFSFWRFLDAWYASEEKTIERGEFFAQELGIDANALSVCMQTGATTSRVTEDKAGAQAKGGFYTVPSFFFFNNLTGELRFVQGAETPAFFEMIIDEMLVGTETDVRIDSETIGDTVLDDALPEPIMDAEEEEVIVPDVLAPPLAEPEIWTSEISPIVEE